MSLIRGTVTRSTPHFANGTEGDVDLEAELGGEAFEPLKDWLVDLVNDLVYLVAMSTVGVHEAKTHLSRLLRRVAAGEEIVIARAGEPVARLVAVGKKRRLLLGRDEGLYELPDDFDAPLPAEVLEDFER